MHVKYGAWAVIGMCALVLIIGGLRTKAEVILNFFVRAMVGMVAIYFIDKMLNSYGINACAGLNFVSFLTTGALGGSGLGLLYGILFLQLL